MAKLTSLYVAGCEMADNAAPVVAAMIISRGTLSRDPKLSSAGAELHQFEQELVGVSESRAVRCDARRPHELVEIRALAGEFHVVVPAGTNVVGNVLVHDSCDIPLRLKERGPAEFYDCRQQPLFVAEVVIREIGAVTPAASQAARVEISASPELASRWAAASTIRVLTLVLATDELPLLPLPLTV